MRPDRQPDFMQEPWTISLLIVDDDPRDRSWLSAQAAQMDEFDADITLASSVREAEAALLSKPFDVALIDYQIGPVLGDEVVRLAATHRPECATILVSGHTMAEVSLFGARAGATAALSKDQVNWETLETAIRFALLNMRRRIAPTGA